LLAELGYPSSAEETHARLERLLASDADRVLVSSHGEALLGVGCVHRFLGIHDTEPIALITAIVVTERARGSGVGRVLLGALEEVARAWGCRRVLVTSANHRAHAHIFYERRGYELTGRRYAKSLA
jgi:GNAT superfamily N-acetyltransferase